MVKVPKWKRRTPAHGDLPGRIFICYRRDDSAGYAGWLAEKLTDRFGRQVFWDLKIDPGEDFRERIESELESCYAFLPVIGRNWLGAVDAGGRRRLEDPEDWVRLEVQSALEADIRVRVIPVLVQGATMPRPEELPDPMARLSYRQAHQLTERHFAHDVHELIGRLVTPRRDRFARLGELTRLATIGALMQNALWRPVWTNVLVPIGVAFFGVRLAAPWLLLVAAGAYLALVVTSFFSLAQARRVHGRIEGGQRV